MNKFICVLLAIASIFVGKAAGAAQKPNIVVFLADDHSQLDSSVYGARDVRTPNMQRLSAAGMTFNQAFVASPACAPSRAALLTGLMPARNGAEANHAKPRPEIKKLPAYLKEQGYEVVAFGKVAHYGHGKEFGFDLVQHDGFHDQQCIPAALNYLNNRASKKPLALFVGTNWPHVPWPKETDGYNPSEVKLPPTLLDTPQTRQARAQYYAAVTRFDTDLGKIYDAVQAQLGPNTLFLHSSDHGAQWPFGKWNCYDEGIRVPLIVSWPGVIKANARTDAMVSWIDILPTLIEVAGGKAPQELDGRSLLPVLRGQAKGHRDRIFATHSGDGNMNVYPIRSVRTSRWKYIRNLHPEFAYTTHIDRGAQNEADHYWHSWQSAAKTNPRAAAIIRRYHERPVEELYDLQADPHEQRNLARESGQAKRIRFLRTELEAWMQAQGDKGTVFNKPRLLSDQSAVIQPAASTVAPKNNMQKPNIVFVFADDMGYGDLGCYGGKGAPTPNIDRLAAEGIRFTQFYVNSPICSPSRTAVTTGQYPARWRMTSYIDNRGSNRRRGMAQWLDPKAPSLARFLKQSGYATGHFGKWHMGGGRDVGDAPLISEYGFDASLTQFEGLGDRVLAVLSAQENQQERKMPLGVLSEELGRGQVRWEKRSQVTKAFVDGALGFMEQAQAQNKPFYINLWPDDVHSPFDPPQERRGDGSKKNLYHGVLQTMDEQLGPLFEAIRNNPKLRDNTLIIFSSDNGPEPGAGSAGPFRGAKATLYEGGVREPFIVWAPGLIAKEKQGSVNSSSVFSGVDLVPSLLEITGIQTPADVKFDGENLGQTLIGKAQTSRAQPLFWKRPPDRPGPLTAPLPDLAVREGKWKLLINENGSQPQLYDLTADSGEEKNLAAEHPELVARLKGELLAWNQTLPAAPGPTISNWKMLAPHAVRWLAARRSKSIPRAN